MESVKVSHSLFRERWHLLAVTLTTTQCRLVRTRTYSSATSLQPMLARRRIVWPAVVILASMEVKTLHRKVETLMLK